MIQLSPLLTDFYQITMAYGYWSLNMHEQAAVFHLTYRKNPFHGNYAIACGLGSLVDFLNEFQFREDDIAYLASLKNHKQQAFFPAGFLNYLRDLRFTCHLDAIPEGSLVFSQIPLIRIEGPLLQCQLLESMILNIINFQTLIATKASRVCRAAGPNNEVIEFGLRRAQGPDGAMSASRAAYIGGCQSTSNTLAGKVYDIPVRGTHAHSWVSAFANEKEAFAAYAKVLPDNCVLLVDTYNTIQGVKNAIEVGKQLRQIGSELLGVRLDSGDIAELSIAARKLLDEAGFQNTQIIASNKLDEDVITAVKKQGGLVTVWGVGTNLVTAYDEPALDGVYKLSALQNKGGAWEYKLKLSEQVAKVSTPGRHQVRRYLKNEIPVMDVIFDIDTGLKANAEAILLPDETKKIALNQQEDFIDLLQPIMRDGNLVQPLPSIHATREIALKSVDNFLSDHNNQHYPIALEDTLYQMKKNIIKQFRC